MFQNPVYMQIGSVLSIIYSAQLVANINMDIKSIHKPKPVTELFQIWGGRGGSGGGGWSSHAVRRYGMSKSQTLKETIWCQLVISAVY